MIPETPGFKLEDDNYCFVCGRDNPIGLRLNLVFYAGRISSEFILQKQYQGYKDIIHGGLISSILDEAMIHVALAQGIKVVTAEMSVRFKRPLFTGERAVVEAQIIKSGRKLIEASAFVKGADLRLIAEAQAKMMVMGSFSRPVLK